MEFVQYGNTKIEFTIDYTDRKTLGITVNSDMSVNVKAPLATKLEKIKEVVLKKGDWILVQKDHFLSFHPLREPKKYVSGESHYYLGRQYQLKVEIADKNEAKYKGKYIHVYTKDREQTQRIVKDWYFERAKIKFAEIASPLIERFEKYNVQPKKIYVKSMKYRWGSCSPKGNIILNPELIQAPKPCIEYVIIHELCHLIYPNHSKDFYRTQSKEMPDWEKWKKKLENLLA